MSGVKESSVCSSTKYLSIVANTALEKDGLERVRFKKVNHTFHGKKPEMDYEHNLQT